MTEGWEGVYREETKAKSNEETEEAKGHIGKRVASRRVRATIATALLQRDTERETRSRWKSWVKDLEILQRNKGH